MNRAAEVVVVGGGPGGLSAALAAAQAGAQVLLLDGYAQPGGQYYRQPPQRMKASPQGQTPDSLPPLKGHARWIPGPAHKQHAGRALWQQVLGAGVEIRSATQVWNLLEDRTLSAANPAGTRFYQPKIVILATGTFERVVPFPGWTLPGVMTSGAAQSLLYQQVRPGKRVLLAGAGPLQLTTAAELLEAGVSVAAVLEGSPVLRKALPRAGALWGQWGRAMEGAWSLLVLARQGVPYRTGWGVVAAHGKDQLEGATIARLDTSWRSIPGSEREVSCDTLCVGFGFVPFNGLARLAGAKHAWHPELGGETPLRDHHLQTSVPGIYAVGDGAGIGGYQLARLEGQLAGLAAAAQLGYGAQLAEVKIRGLAPALARERIFQGMYGALFTPGPGIYEMACEETLVCRCEGVTLGELRRAVLELGAHTASEVKNITRCGMGECQGRVCGSMVNHVIAQLAGSSPEQVGWNAPRPPLFAMPIAQFRTEE